MARQANKLEEVAKELRKYGKCEWMQGDVRKSEDCKEFARRTVEHFGSLDILVNGAAGNFIAQAEKLSMNGFKAVMDIDAQGSFQMCQAVFKEYMKSNGGVIINLSATVYHNGSVLQIHAAAGKAALDGMTKTLACEWGPYNVRVLTLTPGAIIETLGFERVVGFGASLRSKSKEDPKAVLE